MKTLMTIGIMTGLLIGLSATAEAQRGRGDTEGLARQGAQPEMVEIEGTLERIHTGPCERTTGVAYIGTHLFIRLDDDRLINMHVGSADAVKPFVDTLSIGEKLSVTAFRTDRLEEDHYVAKTIRTDNETLEVRGDDLSPFWARQRGERRELRAQRPDRARGPMERQRLRDERRPDRERGPIERQRLRDDRLSERDRESMDAPRLRQDRRPDREQGVVDREQMRERQQERKGSSNPPLPDGATE